MGGCRLDKKFQAGMAQALGGKRNVAHLLSIALQEPVGVGQQDTVLEDQLDPV